MKKFIIRNDDVAFDTALTELRTFCDICDTYGFSIMQAITPIGQVRKITSARMNNDQIRALGSEQFSENVEVVNYLRNRNDLIAVHGLWHTHVPEEDELIAAKYLLEGLGLRPTYFVPPFNEGTYEPTIAGLHVNTLSMRKGQRLEDYLNGGVPTAEVMYLHSWRFNNDWYTFKQLDACLKRLSRAYE